MGRKAKVLQTGRYKFWIDTKGRIQSEFTPDEEVASSEVPKKAKQKCVAPDLFREFLRIYPKPTFNHAIVGRAWKTVVTGEDIAERIIFAVKQQCQPGGLLHIGPDKEMKYIPNPENYLHKMRWTEPFVLDEEADSTEEVTEEQVDSLDLFPPERKPWNPEDLPPGVNY